MRRVILLVISLTSIVTLVNAALAAGDMTSDMTADLICPCECAMIISTCDCPTAVQVRKEIGSMTNEGFSENQIFSALQAEYGKDILSRPEKSYSDSMPLLVAGVPLALILAFLGYTIIRRPKADIVLDREKYEKRFEEEYQEFLSDLEET